MHAFKDLMWRGTWKILQNFLELNQASEGKLSPFHFVSSGGAPGPGFRQGGAPAPGDATLVLAGGSRPRGSGSRLTGRGNARPRQAASVHSESASYRRCDALDPDGRLCCCWRVAGSQLQPRRTRHRAWPWQAEGSRGKPRPMSFHGERAGIRCTVSRWATGVCGAWIQHAAGVQIQACKRSLPPWAAGPSCCSSRRSIAAGEHLSYLCLLLCSLYYFVHWCLSVVVFSRSK